MNSWPKVRLPPRSNPDSSRYIMTSIPKGNCSGSLKGLRSGRCVHPSLMMHDRHHYQNQGSAFDRLCFTPLSLPSGLSSPSNPYRPYRPCCLFPKPYSASSSPPHSPCRRLCPLCPLRPFSHSPATAKPEGRSRVPFLPAFPDLCPPRLRALRSLGEGESSGEEENRNLRSLPAIPKKIFFLCALCACS